MKGDDRYVPAATATSKQISELVKASQNIGAHSAEDLNMLRPGDIITLRGYPWDGVEAEFVRMDPKRKKVIIKLTMIGQRELEVSFDNVFFTIYANHGYDDSLTIRNSLDDMQAKNTLDKFTDKIQKRNGSKTE